MPAARDWLEANRSGAQLLRGAALTRAETWKDKQPATATPAEEVLELILASRQAATRRQRYWAGGSMAVAIGALALAGIAYRQSTVAQRERDAALLTQSRYLAGFPEENRGKGEIGKAVALARRVLPSDLTKPNRPLAHEAMGALSTRGRSHGCRSLCHHRPVARDGCALFPASEPEEFGGVGNPEVGNGGRAIIGAPVEPAKNAAWKTCTTFDAGLDSRRQSSLILVPDLARTSDRQVDLRRNSPRSSAPLETSEP